MAEKQIKRSCKLQRIFLFFFFSFFTQAGGERAVGVLMCLFIQLLNVSCSIKILNLDNTQEQWNEGIFPQRICRQYTWTFLVQTKRHQLSIRHFQFLKESIKSNLLKINVCLKLCVLACSSSGQTSSLLALLRTDRRLAHSRASSPL